MRRVTDPSERNDLPERLAGRAEVVQPGEGSREALAQPSST